VLPVKVTYYIWEGLPSPWAAKGMAHLWDFMSGKKAMRFGKGSFGIDMMTDNKPILKRLPRE
jgi:hypothetical protein